MCITCQVDPYSESSILVITGEQQLIGGYPRQPRVRKSLPIQPSSRYARVHMPIGGRKGLTLFSFSLNPCV